MWVCVGVRDGVMCAHVLHEILDGGGKRTLVAVDDGVFVELVDDVRVYAGFGEGGMGVVESLLCWTCRVVRVLREYLEPAQWISCAGSVSDDFVEVGGCNASSC